MLRIHIMKTISLWTTAYCNTFFFLLRVSLQLKWGSEDETPSSVPIPSKKKNLSNRQLWSPQSEKSPQSLVINTIYPLTSFALLLILNERCSDTTEATVKGLVVGRPRFLSTGWKFHSASVCPYGADRTSTLNANTVKRLIDWDSQTYILTSIFSFSFRLLKCSGVYSSWHILFYGIPPPSQCRICTHTVIKVCTICSFERDRNSSVWPPTWVDRAELEFCLCVIKSSCSVQYRWRWHSSVKRLCCLSGVRFAQFL